MNEVLPSNAVPELTSGQTTATGVVGFVIAVLTVVAIWKIFTKAGEAGWKSIIPFLNLYTLCEIADGNGIKFLLFIIPGVNVIYGILLYIRLAKSFGKGVGFGIGLILLNTIFTLILGFDSSQYIGPRGGR